MSNKRIPTMPQGDAPDRGGRIPTMPQGGAPAGGGRIPTMPQGGAPAGGGRIPTMPQGGAPGGGGRIPTMPQGAPGGDGRIPTMPQSSPDSDGRIATVPQAAPVDLAKDKAPSGGVLPRFQHAEFTGVNGGSFTINGSGIISSDSGESRIFACTRNGSDEKLAVRILTTVFPDSSREALRAKRRVWELLETLSSDPESHIMPLIDRGQVTIGGTEYFAEVYPFFEEGDLGRRSGSFGLEEIKRKIVPQLNTALHKIHENGFVHRDVKPDNIYMLNGSAVLGDFGITCELNADGYATDEHKTGTLGYFAPELMSRAAVPASDYYSLGQTLWTLYSGEMMYSGAFRISSDVNAQRDRINNDMMNNVYYGLDEIPSSDEFFEVLIRGLLNYSPAERFGYDKVLRWVKGDISLTSEVIKDTNKYSRPCTLFGDKCWDNDSLSRSMNAHWAEAREMFFNGAIKDFVLSETRDFNAGRYLDGMMKSYSQLGKSPDLGVCEAIMFLCDYKRISWLGKEFNTLSDVSRYFSHTKIFDTDTEVENYPRTNMGLLAGSGLISRWYTHSKQLDPSVLNALKAMERMHHSGTEGAMVVFQWLPLLSGSESGSLFDGLDRSVMLLTNSPSTFYSRSGTHLSSLSAPFLATLCMEGHYDFVSRLLAIPADNILPRYELLFSYLDGVLEGRPLAEWRSFYRNYGPHGYLTWFLDRIDEFEFHGDACLDLRDRFLESDVDPADPIDRQRDAFYELDKLASELVEYESDDIFLAEIGMSYPIDEPYIAMGSPEGAWCLNFMGNLAPLGFVQDIGMKLEVSSNGTPG